MILDLDKYLSISLSSSIPPKTIALVTIQEIYVCFGAQIIFQKNKGRLKQQETARGVGSGEVEQKQL